MEISYTKENPKAVFRDANKLAIPISMVIWTIFMLVFKDWQASHHSVIYTPSALAAVGLAWVIGLAIAVQVVLFRGNRFRIRAVIRPSLGRILVAIVMSVLTPFAVVGWLPFVIGFYTAMRIDESIILAFFTTSLFTILTAFWYILSCLIVSGVHNKLWRIALFCLMWWACYAGCIMVIGVHRFL